MELRKENQVSSQETQILNLYLHHIQAEWPFIHSFNKYLLRLLIAGHGSGHWGLSNEQNKKKHPPWNSPGKNIEWVAMPSSRGSY